MYLLKNTGHLGLLLYLLFTSFLALDPASDAPAKEGAAGIGGGAGGFGGLKGLPILCLWFWLNMFEPRFSTIFLQFTKKLIGRCQK